MLVGNRLEVIMVHNLPIIVVWTSFKLCSNQTYMEKVLQSVEGEGERGNREREGKGRGRKERREGMEGGMEGEWYYRGFYSQ